LSNEKRAIGLFFYDESEAETEAMSWEISSTVPTLEALKQALLPLYFIFCKGARRLPMIRLPTEKNRGGPLDNLL
jgi:hypothetical protein